MRIGDEMSKDSLGVLSTFDCNDKQYKYFDIQKAALELGFNIKDLPYSLRVLFENALRTEGNDINTKDTLLSFAAWLKNRSSKAEVGYVPARVLMQDFTGVPALVDLAAMRDATIDLGGNPNEINPHIPVDLVIDHSLQVDYSGSKKSFSKNVELEMQRNRERYEFLKWGQGAFENFRVVPPGTGICHQVNVEHLAQVVFCKDDLLYPDTLVGTDSHTTMVNALAVLGWGVGGIEAEAAMLGQALSMVIPEVVGFKITGHIAEGVTATDVVLTITNMLRKRGVVGKFVEFYGEGLKNLTLADRATISNMAPEYGATCGFFAIDEETIKYLNLTARSEEQVNIVESYAKKQAMWMDYDSDPKYTDVVSLNLSEVRPSIAGPKRPQDKILLSDASKAFKEDFSYIECEDVTKFDHGSIVIAAITSCTNTSNPSVMIAAGLVAKKAIENGVKLPSWVKASLAPGSQVVTEYLKNCDLNQYLDELGFNLVGYGCTTCIGNSGPLEEKIEKEIKDRNLVVTSALSGNRNFEGRVHPLTKANYLASPPLVVAYAIAGNMNIDLSKDAIAKSSEGKDLYLEDLWPTNSEIKEAMAKAVTSELFAQKYQDVFKGDDLWQNLAVKDSTTYQWDKSSTYINNPPYFVNMSKQTNGFSDLKNAKILALLGDSITTDHISPAGSINIDSPAAKYLKDNGVESKDFNSYGSRRGNHEIMMRGTFANIRLKNEICPGVEGGYTKLDDGSQVSIYDAAMHHKMNDVPLVVIAGKEYGTGSSRDWAAKGTRLLGVKAVIAESFERIHRSNLVGMGVLPFVFTKGSNRINMGLKGTEIVEIYNLDRLVPYKVVNAKVGGKDIELELQVYTQNEVEYLAHGGILHRVLRTK